MRNMAITTVIYGRLPDVYPIFHIFLPGKTEGLCAETSLFSHTLGEREVSLRLICLINLRLEPRTPLSRTSAQLCVVQVQPGTAGVRVYPGWYRVYIYQGVPLPMHRVVYTGSTSYTGCICLPTHLRVYMPPLPTSGCTGHLSYLRVYRAPLIPQGVLAVPGYTSGCTSCTRVYLRVCYTSGCAYPRVCYTSGCTSVLGIPQGVHPSWVYLRVWENEPGLYPGYGRMSRVYTSGTGRMCTVSTSGTGRMCTVSSV